MYDGHEVIEWRDVGFNRHWNDQSVFKTRWNFVLAPWGDENVWLDPSHWICTCIRLLSGCAGQMISSVCPWNRRVTAQSVRLFNGSLPSSPVCAGVRVSFFDAEESKPCWKQTYYTWLPSCAGIIRCTWITLNLGVYFVAATIAQSRAEAPCGCKLFCHSPCGGSTKTKTGSFLPNICVEEELVVCSELSLEAILLSTLMLLLFEGLQGFETECIENCACVLMRR